MSSGDDCCEIIESPPIKDSNNTRARLSPFQNKSELSSLPSSILEHAAAHLDHSCRSHDIAGTKNSQELLSPVLGGLRVAPCVTVSDTDVPQSSPKNEHSDDAERREHLEGQDDHDAAAVNVDAKSIIVGAQADEEDAGEEEELPPNPFASFAFMGADTQAPRPSGTKRPVDQAGGSRTKPFGFAGGTKGAPARTKQLKGDQPPAVKQKCKWGNDDDFARMSQEELRAMRTRWRGMADKKANDEDQRYQVLVGAVLSSRAQATVVAEGLARLRATEGGLTTSAMMAIEQDELASILRSVHYNKAKSKHIREAAALIRKRYDGIVPRHRKDLLDLPGVGPALVEILVNVYDSWDADNEVLLAKKSHTIDEQESRSNLAGTKICASHEPEGKGLRRAT